MGKGGKGDEFGQLDASEGLLCTVLHPIEYIRFEYINDSDYQRDEQYRGRYNECNVVTTWPVLRFGAGGGLSKPLSVRRAEVVVGADEGEESPRESIDTSTSDDRPRFDLGRGRRTRFRYFTCRSTHSLASTTRSDSASSTGTSPARPTLQVTCD